MGKSTNWTPEKDVELMRLRAEHKTFDAIARLLGVHQSTCQNRWNKISRGETVRYATGRICTWTLEEDAKLIELRAQGMILSEIANAIGNKSKSNCSARAHELNLDYQRPGRKPRRVKSPSIAPARPRRMPLHRQLGIETMQVRVPMQSNRHTCNTQYMSVTLVRV
ncbi:MAG: GcrA family cell cycle regulator [Hyphomicrobium sp.]|jgi:DNA invertase Pin-like site-specific DNA recombinase